MIVVDGADYSYSSIPLFRSQIGWAWSNCRDSQTDPRAKRAFRRGGGQHFLLSNLAELFCNARVAQTATDELIRLVASILDDGEVTGEEVYGLAEWLNNYRPVAEEPLVLQLVRALQEIWADGSTNARELHRFKRLLISVQREWAKRVVRSPAGEGEEAVTISAEDVHDVRLPSVPVAMRVPSRTTPGVVYDVDLRGPSCSCPDWRGRRAGLATGDFSRCCKHVFDAYAALPRKGPSDEWLLAFLDYGWPSHPKAKWELLTGAPAPVLFSTAGDGEWSNVFAVEDGSYVRFGYNTDEDRWAYNSKPENFRVIVEAIVAASNL